MHTHTYIHTCTHKYIRTHKYTCTSSFSLSLYIILHFLTDKSLSATLSGDTPVRSGDDLVLTCTGTGYPQVSVNFEYDTMLSNVTVGDEVVTSTATPNTPFTVARNITVRNVTVRECMERITCVANATNVTASTFYEIGVASELNDL